ncbi:hypothetical protein GQ457_04G016320 [Hibiscus cannabinus]
MGDANKTSSGTTKFVESGQHSTQMSLPMNHNTTVAVSHNEKPSKFTGQNLKTWHQKMLFYLTMLNLTKYLNEDSPVVAVGDGEGEADDLTAFSITQAWEQGDFLCQNYILNGLHDSLYRVYDVHKTTKSLWAALDHKYKAEDAGTKKHLVAKFLNFTMVDSRSVVIQAEEFILIIHGIIAEGMTISESFQVAIFFSSFFS